MKSARKPRLTAKVVDQLSALAGYSEANAEMMGDTQDEVAHKREINAAVDWIRRLCRWHESKNRTSRPQDKPLAAEPPQDNNAVNS